MECEDLTSPAFPQQKRDIILRIKQMIKCLTMVMFAVLSALIPVQLMNNLENLTFKNCKCLYFGWLVFLSLA